MAARSRRDGDTGSVTIEAAIALSVVVVVLALCLSGIGCAIAQVRCVDAAREAARLAARGDESLAAGVVASMGPPGAALSLRIDGDTVIATVTASGVGGLLPGISVRATTVAAVEDSVGAGDPDGAGAP
jgi:hypothetical protein